MEPAPKKSARLTQLGAKIAKLPLTFEMTGYTTEIIIGTARPESNIQIKDCILSDWVLQFKEGGTVVAGLSLESPDVSKLVLGELGSMKSRTMPMTMTPPEVHQADIEDDDGDADSVTPARPRKPGAAEKHAAARAGKDVGPAPVHKTASTVSGEGAWPFPKKDKGANPATPEAALAASGRPAQSRTARGRDKTKAALEAGAKAHAEANAGEAA